MIRSLLDGEPGPKRDVVVLNAAAGLMAAGRASDMAAGLKVAAAVIDDGRALDALERLITVSASALGPASSARMRSDGEKAVPCHG